MEVYLVGGAVRDELLGFEVTEHDYVVVGESRESMEALGFKQVGRDFPVYLHPKTGDEYALARTERKSGKGYTGFVCDASRDVSLEQDLLRRDLTINAIAKDDSGRLIDPYGGKIDLEQKLLRHISGAFAEDPLRVLRVARFAARFAHLGFTVAPSTMTLMRQMVMEGELQHLTPERVWLEFEKALASGHPDVFIRVLRACGALSVIFPALDKLFGVPASTRWHPEVDTGEHVLMSLQEITKLSQDKAVRFAVLVHDLGKGETPPQEWPSHHGHDERGVPLIDDLLKHMRVPNQYLTLAKLVSKYHILVHKVMELKASTILKICTQMDLFRKPERFNHIILACSADFLGRKGAASEYPSYQCWQEVADTLRAQKTDSCVGPDKSGEEIQGCIYQMRLKAIKEIKHHWDLRSK